jgi:hypothetical protein
MLDVKADVVFGLVLFTEIAGAPNTFDIEAAKPPFVGFSVF